MTLKYLTLSLALVPAALFAQENPVEQALKRDGAQITLPVATAKEPFDLSFIEAARPSFNAFHWQMGGDHALYYNLHMTELLPTAVASPSALYQPLERDIRPELDKLLVETSSKGQMTMAQYLDDPLFRTQGFMLIHKGKVVYEAYPGMQSQDQHIWASSAKTTVGALVAMLVEEGKVDVDKSITHYVPELKGTTWDRLSVAHLLHHASALDNEETAESIMNQDSDVVRLFATLTGSPRPSTGEPETWLQVARESQPLANEEPGSRFRYASMNTIILTRMIENIENTSWIRVFQDRVWSKVTARQPMLVNLTEDGTAVSLGLVSTTLEDKARWGMLFTPSWPAVATEQVISPEMLTLMRQGGNPSAFADSAKARSAETSFNEPAENGGFQFDHLFADGAMGKSGNQGQYIYIDPERDFVGVVFATTAYHSGYGESKAPALMRSAARQLAGQ